MDKQYVFSFDGEDYSNGIFNSLEEALKEAKETYPEAKEVWIGQANHPELRWVTHEDYIIDSIMESLYDDCGEFADCFGVTTDIEIDLGKMLDSTIEEWIKKHNLKPNCFMVSNEDLYNL